MFTRSPLTRSLKLRRARAGQRGAALLMSMLVLFVLVALVFQISVTAQTDARSTRNDVNLTAMDLACESALLQVYDSLATDGDAAGAAESTGTPAAAPTGEGAAPADPNADPAATAAAPGGEEAAVDSRRDEWAQPQRTEINEMRLRIIVQDEDSKYNVLNLLNPDEKEADAAFARVVRILDQCRDGTDADIDESMAQQMAQAMREHMTKRKTSAFPRASLLTDDEENQDQGYPLSLREFQVLKPFEESHFRDFRDGDGKIVHTIEAFLTVWSSLASSAEMLEERSTATPAAATPPANNTNNANNANRPPNAAAQAAAPAAGAAQRLAKSETNGYGINVNTAPAAVLKSLFDDREVAPRYWDKVIEHRNLEEEKKEGEEEEDPADAPLDEYGRPVIKRRIFEKTSELAELDGWENLVPAAQDMINKLCSTQSHVFTIYVIARRSTAIEGESSDVPDSAEAMRMEEERGDSLVRVVRSVVWRTKREDKVVIVPVMRWEVLDYIPHEVVDFPDEER
jgi:hypothetical protein